MRFTRRLQAGGCLLFAWICLVSLAPGAPPARADGESDGGKPEAAGERAASSDPFCGVFCLYAALRMQGKEADLHDLIVPEYIGSPKGSSLFELQRAATDFGLHAETITHISTGFLKRYRYPVILHVKSSPTSKAYDHFVLYLGTADGKARIFDPPGLMLLLPFRELLPRWSGNVLLLAPQPIKRLRMIAAANVHSLLCIVPVAALVLFVLWAKTRIRMKATATSVQRLGLSGVQAAAAGAFAVVLSMAWHGLWSGGFLLNAEAVAALQLAHRSDFMPRVHWRTVHKRDATDTILIDARRTRDYARGHIRRAINIPVDANDTELAAAVTGISRQSPVIVYCQSVRCRFAEQVAVRLAEIGFCDISLFPGGWEEWSSHGAAIEKYEASRRGQSPR